MNHIFKYTKLIAFLVVLFLPLFSWGNRDTLMAKRYMITADSLTNLEDYHTANQVYKKAAIIFKNANHWEGFIQSHISRAFNQYELGLEASASEEMTELVDFAELRVGENNVLTLSLIHI